MKRFLFLLLTGIFFLTVQTTLLTSPLIQRIRPDLLFVLTLYLGFSLPTLTGGILAFFLAYLMDLFSGNHLSLYMLSRPLIFVGVQLTKNRFYWQGFPSQFLFPVVFAHLEGGMFLVFLLTLSPHSLHHFSITWLDPFLPRSLCTAILTPILFSWLHTGMSQFERKDELGLRRKA